MSNALRGKLGSVTGWIGDLKSGKVDAAEPLLNRYFERLIGLARAKLRADRVRSAGEDEEDAAPRAAFDSFCDGAMRGQFPNLELTVRTFSACWVVITARKALDQLGRKASQKRGGGYHASDSLEQIAGTEPDPHFVAMVADELRHLLLALGKKEKQVALWKMEGLTRKEIGDRLNVSERTVANYFKTIRTIWKQSIDDDKELD